MDIAPFDVDRADRAELDSYYQFRVACAADWSDEPPPPFDAAIGWLRHPMATVGPSRMWIAREDGSTVAIAIACLPTDQNSHLCILRVVVRPGFRRRGIATELVRHVLPALAGRTDVEGWSVRQDGTGQRWASRLGFGQVHATLGQQLVFARADPALWDVTAPVGYRAVRWTDTAPDDLVVSYARARNAIHDAVVGDTGYRSPQWTVARVRDAEAGRRAEGFGTRVVAAVHEADGEVAGFTEVVLSPLRADRAVQGETAVPAEHRGHGLGRYVKARMARWLRADLPDLQRVITSTGAANEHMIRVNHQVGYVDLRTTLFVRVAVPELAARLAEPR